MFDIEYLQNFIFQKIKWFKVFQKPNIFLFSDREFNADQKCSECLFSISDKIKFHFLSKNHSVSSSERLGVISQKWLFIFWKMTLYFLCFFLLLFERQYIFSEKPELDSACSGLPENIYKNFFFGGGCQDIDKPIVPIRPKKKKNSNFF